VRLVVNILSKEKRLRRVYDQFCSHMKEKKAN
jgi:hypothetical protein